VTLLRRDPGAGEFGPVASVSTDERGVWRLTLPGPVGAEYRFTWAGQ
jgi:hypothetical protein